MLKKILTFVLLSGLLLSSGCGLLPDQIDETTSWSASKLYTEARSEMEEGRVSMDEHAGHVCESRDRE